MKKSIILLILILPLSLFGQNIRCLTSSSYSVVKNGGTLTTINKPISVCFTDYYFSFYTPGTGTRTFKIAHNSLDTLNHGYTRQRFMNEEDETNMAGDYNVEVDYGIKKTVVISFTKFGEAYIVQAPNFAGSVEQTKGKYESIKKTMAIRLKEDTIQYPNYVSNPQLKNITAKSNTNIETYISENVNWTRRQKEVGYVGKADFVLLIDTSGYVKDVRPNKGQSAINLSAFPVGSRPDEIFETIALVLKNMPRWSKPHDKNGRAKEEQCVVHVRLTAK